jgi:hypothetical protein
VLSPIDYNIASKISGFTSVRDEQTKTQYAYNDFGFVSYDDERAICEKTEYAMDRNLNGYIIWEISGDLMPDLSTPLLDATNNRLNKPDVRCNPADTLTPTPLPTNAGVQNTPMATPKPTQQPSISRTSSPTHNDSIVTIIPKDEDILFGKGSNGRNHPGNIRLRQIVDEFRPAYIRKCPSSFI